MGAGHTWYTAKQYHHHGDIILYQQLLLSDCVCIDIVQWLAIVRAYELGDYGDWIPHRCFFEDGYDKNQDANGNAVVVTVWY